MKKTIIIDNHEIYSNKFCELLEKSNWSVEYIFQSSKHAIEYLKDNLVEVVFCDIFMPELNGFDLVKEIRKNSSCKVVFLSMYTEKNIVSKDLLKKIDSYIPSSYTSTEIKGALSNFPFYNKKEIVKGERKELIKNEIFKKYKITNREKEIIYHVLKQKSSVEIAEELLISKRTVEVHRSNIIGKFKVKNTLGIAMKLFNEPN